MQDFQYTDLIESICLDVHVTGPRKIIHLVRFIEELRNDKFQFFECFCEFSKNSCPVLVVGDFNLPKIDWQNLYKEASENCREKPLGKSDHFVLQISLRLSSLEVKSKKMRYMILRKMIMMGLRNLLLN